MALTGAEIQRYKRHLLLKEVGGPGQLRLKAARVLVVGAGGLGSPILMYLAAAGVGTLGIVDHDTVSLDNLQRQIAHTTADIGRSKVESARDCVGRINPEVAVETHRVRIDASNAMALIGRYDIVVDGSDNFPTRYLVSDACCLAARTLVFAAQGPYDGYVTTFKPYLKGEDGNPYPSYRCIFPDAPAPGTVPNCEETGVLGAIVGVLGTLAATEVLKEILALGDSLAGRLLLYDARAARFESVMVGFDPDNPLTGARPAIRDLSIHACGPSSRAGGGGDAERCSR